MELPTFRRQFKHEFQNHSCELLIESFLFKNRSTHIKELYDVLLKELGQLGQFRIEVVRPDVAMLKTESHFLQVKVKKEWLDIRFYPALGEQNKYLIKLDLLPNIFVKKPRCSSGYSSVFHLDLGKNLLRFLVS